MKFAVFVVLLALTGAWAEKARFDNYKVYRLIPKTDEHLAQLRQLEDSGLGFDMWRGPSAKNIPVDIMVPPHLFAEFQEFTNKIQIQATSYIQDVQKLVDETTPSTKARNIFGWTSYHSLSEINAWMQTLAIIHPDTVSVIIGGRSYEGRDIMGVRVSYGCGRKSVFIEGGIHAREWIAPATVTYILNELLTSQDPTVRDIAESFDWYFFPSTNPDGYEYTHTSNRMWRKTRQPYGKCTGADPNRNWGYHWMDGGASDNPCSETYAGPSAFSEPETKYFSEYISAVHEILVAYIGFHSYSQLLLIPYGHSNAHVENYVELKEIGDKAATSLSRRYGTNYTVGNIVDVIYVASGGSMDWVKANYGIPITYTYELRDTGRHGFLLPPEQIIPTGEETLDSLVTILQETKARGYDRLDPYRGCNPGRG